ncbi:hypothetical protein L596_008685 [Steinernema carpocapsae]|uniref:Uncharacterized protein n=1 Tax=Steinernema carpocapsae TaxID=34508 RepID=A0A4U5PDH4_STECR|nr:hypothetical protein L596_008685 [Steinernema carpocapsae]
MRTAQKKAVEARKALLLYEPWMDNKAKSPSLHDFVDSPGMFPKMKPRSQYRFDKEYVRSISKTPTAMTVPPLLTPPPMGPPPIQQVPVAIKKTFIQVPSPIQPTTVAVVSPPPVNEPRKSNFEDYYKWLWNGREDDIDPVEIEKMLFKTRPSRRKK